MKVFRNREYRIQFLLYLLFAVLFSVAGFFLDYRCGLLVLGAAVVFAAIHLVFLKRRYDRIARLSEQIDAILHDPGFETIAGEKEGELAILESELRKMTSRLREQTDRLTKDKIFLSDAIADIFHQLRTPLTSMNLLLSLLEEEDLPAQKRIELVQSLKKLTERMRWMVEALLKMSKIDAGTAVFKSDRVSVEELARRAAEPFQIPMELREQSLKIDAGNAFFKGDLLWCAEALSNILKNCMEHTPAGGAITLTASENSLYTEITVTDTGKGFDKEDLPYLFDRFYKGKNATDESIGIGLALSRMIVTAQNGTLTAKNAPDGGATFIMRFYKSVV